MKTRLISILIGAGLVASAVVVPARAQEPPTTEVPAAFQIDDPFGDANFLNDQDLYHATACPTPCQGDNTTASDGGSVSDIGKIWFSNTNETVSVHIQTQAPPPASTTLFYRVYSNPDTDVRGCLRWQAVIGGKTQGQDTSTWRGADFAEVQDTCTPVDRAPADFSIETLGDGSGLLTITAPIGFSPLLEGGVITKPYAITRFAAGVEGAVFVGERPQIDNTKRGSDYVLESGGPVVEPVPDKPDKPEPPVKKGCKKNADKGKKKGCKKGKGPKKPPASACAPYVPGEQGAEAELITVTDKATAEEPIEIEFDAGAGKGGPLIGGVPVPPDQTVHNYHNVQVDSDSAEVGLYARLEFAEYRDYDLYLLHPDGSRAAWAGDFNAAPNHDLGSQSGGESGTDFEQVTGIRTADCGGYTTDSVSYLSEGGTVTLKLWLGEVANDPQAPGSAQEALYQVLAMF